MIIRPPIGTDRIAAMTCGLSDRWREDILIGDARIYLIILFKGICDQRAVKDFAKRMVVRLNHRTLKDILIIETRWIASLNAAHVPRKSELITQKRRGQRHSRLASFE
jgi:hypothetical protein